jgi:TPP-dependent pyruvate/acetoin dehydrogenase alpha subunit
MTAIKTTHAARVAGKNGFSLISDEKFRELYTALLRCSLLDNRLQTGPSYERWTGREAGTAGVATCLRAGDSVTPTPQGLLAGYLQNGSLTPMRRPAPGAVTQLAAATGEGLRHKLEKLGCIAAVFACAGEPDRMREIFATASHHSLPVFYVFESGVSLADVCGNIPVIRVDGSDAVAVYRVAHESITRARDGGGPTIMECATWHCDGEPQDPLARLEHYLAGKKLFRKDWKQRLEKKYGRAVDKAVQAANMNSILTGG